MVCVCVCAGAGDVRCPQIDTQQLDRQIKAIMTEVIPFLKVGEDTSHTHHDSLPLSLSFTHTVSLSLSLIHSHCFSVSLCLSLCLSLQEHMEEVCSLQLLQAVRRMVLTLTQQNDESKEFVRFFHRQLGGILQVGTAIHTTPAATLWVASYVFC